MLTSAALFERMRTGMTLTRQDPRGRTAARELQRDRELQTLYRLAAPLVRFAPDRAPADPIPAPQAHRECQDLVKNAAAIGPEIACMDDD